MKHFFYYSEVDRDDTAIVGEKAVTLSNLYRNKIPLQPGFIIPSTEYFRFFQNNDIRTKIQHLLQTINYTSPESVQQVSNHIQTLIIKSELSQEFVQAIYSAYHVFNGSLTDSTIQITPALTSEISSNTKLFELPQIHNIQGEANLFIKIRESWAALFSPRHILAFHEHSIDIFRMGVSLIIQKTLEEEASGVLHTVHPITHDSSVMVIEAIYGNLSLLKKGLIVPDTYEINTMTRSIHAKHISTQTVMEKRSGVRLSEVLLTQKIGKQQKISDADLHHLATIGKALSDHFLSPQEIEWCKEKGQLFIISTQPLHQTIDIKSKDNVPSLPPKSPLLAAGKPASPGIVSGHVKMLLSLQNQPSINDRDILIVSELRKEFIPLMKKAAGIISENGGHSSQASFFCRQIGIPAIVSVPHATRLLKNHTIITINGRTGQIFSGGFRKSVDEKSTNSDLPQTVTKIYTTFSDHENHATTLHDGIGLLKGDDILKKVGIHPKRLIRDGKKKWYVQEIATYIESACKIATPAPVFYQLSNLSSSEYKQLSGGNEYELHEPNPLLGYRGTYRHLTDQESVLCELEAILRVRNTLQRKNLSIVIPFVRSVKELTQIKKLISSTGIYRSSTCKIYILLELPSNLITLEKMIATGIDGVIIDIRSLATYLLAVDPTNPEITHQFNEEDPSVLWTLENTIAISKLHTISTSLYLPSGHPSSLIEKAVQKGVTSITVHPKEIEATRNLVAIQEKKLLS